MDNNEELNRNLVLLLKMFKNRPYHLSKYLIDNSALSQEFIKKLLKSDKLKELSEQEELSSVVPVHFVNISQMDEFYKSFIDDIDQISKHKSLEEITIELNKKLNQCIKNEKYEEAARIRDYMLINGIKRINNNF